MEDFFGGSLSIKDAFSNTFNQFNSAVSKASNGFAMFTNAVGESERANRLATQNMKNQIAQLSQAYIKEGYTMGQALRKATSEVSREAPKSGNAWVDAFGRIKQVGIGAFEGINSTIQSFSNSTLGMITKLTAGFLSLKTVKKGLEIGFETGSEYQNLRLVLDNLYKNSSVGAEKFTMATNFASNSIWQEKDVVRSLAMLKGSGLNDSKSSLTEKSDLGSYAKAMGVGDINTATRAYAEMMMGRWNMMTMELSINREEVEKYAKQNNMKSFDNKNGEITDKSALEKAFKGFMDQRGLTGLTDKMKDTFTGRLSTLKDNINKSLADLIGVGNDGAVKSDSMFKKFCDGIQKFTTKIQQFSESDKFQKIGDEVSKLGGAISTGFNYLLDHPEIASDLLQLSVGLWALGKVSSVIGTFTTIIGAFSEGGMFASLGAVLLPIAPYVLAVVGGFLALKSILSPDGLLHKGISWLLGNIPFVGSSLQEAFEVGSKTIYDFFSEIWDWIKSKFGFGTDDKNQSTETDPSKIQWYGGKDGKTPITDSNYKTASDMLKDGSITKNNSSAYNNKTDVNINIEKVEKTADIDEIMNEAVNRMDKHAQTRNNLDD